MQMIALKLKPSLTLEENVIIFGQPDFTLNFYFCCNRARFCKNPRISTSGSHHSAQKIFVFPGANFRKPVMLSEGSLFQDKALKQNLFKTSYLIVLSIKLT